MKEWIAVAVLLYSVPLFALLLTWKKPLWQALRGIVLSEVLETVRQRLALPGEKSVP